MTTSRLYLLSQTLTSLANSVMFTTYTLYYVQALGLSPLQLVLVGTAVEVAVLLFEVPTGVVADAYSRRTSVIIGSFVMAGAYLLEGAIPFWGKAVTFFWAVAVAEVIRGIGWTFISGAEEAWITDEVGVEQVGALHLRAGQLQRIAGLAGIALSVALANIALYLPYLAGGAIILTIGCLQLLYMPETAFRPRPRGDRSHWSLMGQTFAEGIATVRARPVLLSLLVVTVVAGAASEGIDRLWEAHMLITFRLSAMLGLSVPTLFGIFSALGSLLGIGVAAVARRTLDFKSERAVARTLLVSAAVRVGLLLVFALAPAMGLAAGAILLFRLTGAVYYPMYRAWLNQQIDSRVRATVLSLVGQSDALGQSLGGPAVGWVSTRFSLRAGLTLAAAFLAPSLALFGKLRPGKTTA
ncbi:MAG TPA: MFS transporter [Symbiobacteriaceae bacterium]|nr:MFS transporter [Symbiobacteriaceae bacterium]